MKMIRMTVSKQNLINFFYSILQCLNSKLRTNVY